MATMNPPSIGAPSAPASTGRLPARPGARALRESARTRVQRILEPLGKRFGFRFYMLPFMPYYWAIPERSALPDRLWETSSDLPGVDLRIAEQLALLEEMAQWAPEYADLPLGFGPVDAETLYCILRRCKPRRMIEIGSGHSTRVAARALSRNAAETGISPELTAIEPYPDEGLRRGFPGLTRLLATMVQDVPIETFAQLSDGDVLFIDSSLVLAIGSDVQYEFLEIIPRLAPGVLVHVHDIYLPREYHKHWVMAGRFWGEQYLLQAFLQFNSSFEVLLANQYLHQRHPADLRRIFPAYDPAGDSPSSFWMRRTR